MIQVQVDDGNYPSSTYMFLRALDRFFGSRHAADGNYPSDAQSWLTNQSLILHTGARTSTREFDPHRVGFVINRLAVYAGGVANAENLVMVLGAYFKYRRETDHVERLPHLTLRLYVHPSAASLGVDASWFDMPDVEVVTDTTMKVFDARPPVGLQIVTVRIEKHSDTDVEMTFRPLGR